MKAACEAQSCVARSYVAQYGSRVRVLPRARASQHVVRKQLLTRLRNPITWGGINGAGVSQVIQPLMPRDQPLRTYPNER